jgi:hypothetical protein
MNVKYYPSRDDNRAYCADKNRLRSLVASCLNRLVAPKKMWQRQNLHTASVLRPDKKDILDLHLPPIADDEMTSLLIITDTSNFTGSLANAWLMIYIMGLELAQGRLDDRTQLFSIGGHFIAATWKELLLLYVFLTVGVPCYVEELSMYGFLSGGFLGVGGNITIGLLCLAVCTKSILYRLRNRVFSIHAQAGGDDLAFAVTCRKIDKEEIIGFILEEMTAYVGKVKEVTVTVLDELEPGIIRDTDFCKKRVTLEKDLDGLHLRGEPSIPIAESLIPSGFINRYEDQIKAWYEWDHNLRVFDDAMPDCAELTDSLRQMFLETYRSVKPCRSYQVKYLTGSIRLMRVGRSLVTSKADARIKKVPTIRYGNITALADYESKTRYALINEFVSIEKVDMGYESGTEIIVERDERALLHRKVYRNRIHLRYSVEKVVELISLVES